MTPYRVAELVDVEAVEARLQVAHVAAYLDGAGSLKHANIMLRECNTHFISTAKFPHMTRDERRRIIA